MKRISLSVLILSLAASAFSLPNLVQRELFKVNKIQNIDLDLAWENIDIQECDEPDNILVEIYCNKTKVAPEIKSFDSTIKVESNKNSLHNVNNKKCTVIIRIPDSAAFEKFYLSSTSGSIHTQIVINAQKFISESTSGSQSITKEVFAPNAKLTSTSGSIFAEAIYGETLVSNATSGSINVQRFEGKNCSLGATSGSVKLVNADLEQVKVSTTSGRIVLEGNVLQAFDIGSTSGSIGLELYKGPAKNSKISCTSGSVFLGLPGDSNYSLAVQTTSGSFTDAISKVKMSSHVNYKGNINKGGPTIIINTTSGSITIDSTNGVSGAFSDSTVNDDVPVVSFDDPIF